MLSKYNDEERKKKEEEFDAMFSNNAINNSNYQQRATEFDNVFGGNNIDYQTRANEFEVMFGNKQGEIIDTNSNVDDTNGIDLSKYPDLEPGDSVEKTVIRLNNKEIEGVPQYEESKESKERKERYNVIVKGGKLESLKTEQDRQEEEAIKYNKQQANSDKNLFSQFGKMIENFWLGITSGTKEIAKETTKTSYNNKQENELLAGPNPNVPDIVKEEYKYQINENDLLKRKMNQKVNATSLFKINTNTLTQQPLLKGDTAQSIDNELNQYKDAFGDLELNPVTRNLSKSIAQDQNKIATNVNEIDNPIIKKVSELAPSAGNSLAGAGISMVNPYLGMSYFMISAMGSYEDDGRRRGMSKQEAESYGKIMGFMEGATEMIGVDKFLSAGNAVRKGSFKEALRNYGLDMVDNAIQEAVIDPIDELMAGQIAGNEYQKNNYSTMNGYIDLLGEMIRDGVDGALSSLLMNGIGLSIDSSVHLYNKIQNNKKITETDVKNAYTDIQNNPNIDVSEAFKSSFDYEKQKLQENNRDTYRFLEFDNEGNIVAVKEAIGEKIPLENKQLNIEPIIVNVDGYYNVIDDQSGLKLDTTMYNSVQEAKVGFNEQIKNASQSTINEINQKVNKSKLAIINKMQEMTEDKAVQDMNNVTDTFINQQSKQVVQPDKVFSTEETKTILSNNNVDTSKIKNRPYLGQEINDIIQTTTEQNTGNLDVEPTSYTKGQQNLTQGDTNKAKGTSNNPSESNFYTGNKKYSLKDINKTTGYFKNNKQYKLPDIEEIYNFDMETEDITTYDDKGNETGYIDIVQNGENIKIQQYDNDNNVIKEQIIPSKNGKVLVKAVNEAIKEMTTDYDENRPIKGQLDVEGNQVRNGKKSKMTDEQIRDIVKYNQDGREIKDANYVDFMVERYKDNKNISGIKITTDETNEILKSTYEKALSLIDSEDEKAIKNKQKNLIIDEMFEKIKDKKFKIEKTFIDENKKESKIILDLEITKKGINESLNKSLSIEKISVIPYLDKLIKTSENGIIRNETKNRRNILGWYYIYNTTMINNKLYGVKIDLKKTNLGDRFYVHRVNIIKGDSNFVPSFEYATKENLKAPTINNSISQNNKNVKNETAINKKSMQKEKNNTSNDEIRSMKKPSLKVEYDSQGRQLSRQQQEFFKDSKIRDENGRLLELYHGSNSEFTVFDLEKSGQASTESKVGFWFTESEKGAKKFADSVWYGDKKPTIYKTYLDIKNPKIFEQANTKEQKINNDEKIKELKKELRKFNEKYEYADTSFSMLKTLYNYASFGDSTPQSRLEYFIKHGFSEDKAKQIIEEVESYNKVNEQIKNLEKENDNLGYDDAYEQFKTMLYSYSGQTASEANMGGIGMMLKDYSAMEKMRNDLIAQGYDGIIIKNTKYDASNFEGENNQYVAFYPEQIKNVTNTNPTSNVDIRYMKNNNNQKQSNEAKRTIRPEKGKTNIEREDSFIEQEIQQLEKTNNFDPNIPMTKISDIVKDIEKYLKSRILTKYIDYRSYGVYKVNRDIIRVQEKSDLDTILHEMAHMLDNRLHLQKENLALELLTKDVWKLYGKYPESIQLEEGFAEVVRQYYIQPEKAKNKYPDTIKFIEDLRKSDQAFDNFSSKLQQDIYNYIHQTENNRAKSRMSAKEIKEKQSLKEMKDTVIDRTITALWDEDYKLQKYTDRLAKIAGFQDIYQVPNSENPVVANRLKKGIANAIDDMLKHGIIDKQTGKRVTRGLSEIDTILENENIADFSTYLLSLRSIEAFEKGKKTGIRYNDAKAVVEEGNKNNNFLKAKEIIQEYNDGLLEYAKEGGILSDKQIDTIKKYWLNYVPMFRVQENISNQNQKNNGNPLKRFIGSDRDIINPLEGIITNTINIVSQVNKNTVIKQFYDLGEYAGLTDEVYDILTTPPVKKVATATLEMFKKELENQGVDTSTLDLEAIYDIYYPDERDRPNELITSFKVDGERKYIQFLDKDLYKIFTNMNTRELNGLEKIINFTNSIFKAGTTGVNLAFAIPNMISDSQQAYVMSEANFLPIYSSAKGVYDTVVAQLKANGMIKDTDKNTELELMYSIYLQSGASQAGRISRYRKDLEQQLIEIYKKKYKDFGMKKNQLKEFEKAAKYVCELSEEATRFENFMLELQKAVKEGKSPQEAIATAAINTSNLTIDFAVKGELSKVINVVVPYFSAKMAGLYNAYGKVQKTKSNAKASYQKTMSEQIQSANDVQRAKKEARKTAVKSVSKPVLTLLSLIAFNMIRKAFTDDDDKVKELNDQKKYDNYVFSNPFNENEVITIKKPQGVLRDIINTAEFLQDLVSGNIEEGKAGEKFVELIKSIAENNSGTDTVGGLIPPIIKVPMELGVNKDFYYNSEIVKENDLKDLKPKDQYYEYNTTASIGLGQVFNVSPAKIDFSIRGLFGQAAFDLWSGFSSVIDLISGNEKADLGASNKYLLKRFFANPDNNSNSLNDFYDKLNELNVKDNYNELTKEEETQYENMKIASSSISKINKQIKEIKTDDNLSDDEKGEKILELQNQRTDTARQALGKSLIDWSNTTKIETTKFYPSRNTLTNNGYTLEMTAEMQKEYSQIASDYYNKYAKQGLYSDKKLEDIKEKAKDYAKSYMMSKYKSQLIKKEKEY